MHIVIKKTGSCISLDLIPVLQEVDHFLLDVLIGRLGHLYFFEIQTLQDEDQL